MEQTVRREVLEETGWVIHPPRLLGVKHFRHLSPKPAGYGYRYLYPDFFQVVYGAQAHRFDPGGRETDGYELGAELQPTAHPLPPSPAPPATLWHSRAERRRRRNEVSK